PFERLRYNRTNFVRVPAPTHSRRLARRITQTAYQIAHDRQWTKDYVAGHSTDHRGEVRDDDVIGAVLAILLACQRFVQPVALATKHGKADHECDHGAEHAHGPKATNGLDEHRCGEDQYVEELAGVSGAKPGFYF